MRRFTALSTLAAVLVAGPACGDGGSESSVDEAAKDASGGTQAFFSQTAQTATVRTGRLVLDGVAPSVTAISDRPARSVTRIGLASFVETWRSRFGQDPPNAIVSGEMSGGERSAEFVLDDPSYDANARRLTYEAKPIGGRATVPTLRLADVSLVTDLAPATTYSLKITPPAGQTGKTIALAEIADVRVVITEAPGGDAIELNVESAEQDDYLEVKNDTDSTVGVEVTRDSTPIEDSNLRNSGELFFKPPPVTSP